MPVFAQPQSLVAGVDSGRCSREEQAVRNLGWLRATIELNSVLSYFDQPHFRRPGYLVADARLVGAAPFMATLRALAVAGEELRREPLWDGALVDFVLELEVELLEIEARAVTLWQSLAAFSRPSAG